MQRPRGDEHKKRHGLNANDSKPAALHTGTVETVGLLANAVPVAAIDARRLQALNTPGNTPGNTAGGVNTGVNAVNVSEASFRRGEELLLRADTMEALGRAWGGAGLQAHPGYGGQDDSMVPPHTR